MEEQEHGEQQFARTDIRKQSFAVRAVEKRNRLPDRVRVEEKTYFDRRLKKAIRSPWKADKR
jgi:hypothetical protein